VTALPKQEENYSPNSTACEQSFGFKPTKEEEQQ
jgi:hypothetical protein